MNELVVSMQGIMNYKLFLIISTKLLANTETTSRQLQTILTLGDNSSQWLTTL